MVLDKGHEGPSAQEDEVAMCTQNGDWTLSPENSNSM